MEERNRERRSPNYQASWQEQARQMRRIRQRRRWAKLLTAICILAVIGGGYVLVKDHKNTPATAKTMHITTTVAAKTPPATAALTTMSQSIKSVITQNSNIDISVNLINLSNGQAEHYGTNDTFQAASTAKIITAACWLHEVEEGQQSMSQPIDGETPQYELQQMIVISDDTAWANLNNTIGYTNLQNYADGLGVTQYQAYNNSLTSGDIALVLQKLWDGDLLNKSDTQMVLGYMKEANYRQYIVPAIPSNDTIYHKIGLYDDYVNDAAIVTHGNQAFEIVIFTNGNGAYNWPARAAMMQQIARAALKYYFNQTGVTPSASATANSSTTT